MVPPHPVLFRAVPHVTLLQGYKRGIDARRGLRPCPSKLNVEGSNPFARFQERGFCDTSLFGLTDLCH